MLVVYLSLRNSLVLYITRLSSNRLLDGGHTRSDLQAIVRQEVYRKLEDRFHAHLPVKAMTPQTDDFRPVRSTPGRWVLAF